MDARLRTVPSPAWRRARPWTPRPWRPLGWTLGRPRGRSAALGRPDVRPRLRRRPGRTRRTTHTGTTGRRTLRDPRRAVRERGPDQRLPGDPADRRPHGRCLEAEPRLGLPD